MAAVALSLFPLTLAVLTPSTAMAQTEREQARKLGEAGLEAFSAERWQEAYDRFQEADRLFHAPTLVLFMARCQDKLGKPVEAVALYERLLQEEIPKGASKAFVEAQDTARTELPAVQAQIATLKVVLTNAESANPQVLVDGAPVPPEALDGRKMNPGEHSVEVVVAGTDPIVQTVTLEPGGSKTVEIALPVRKSAPPPPPPAAEPQEGSLLPAIAAFAVGAAGLGVGAVTGIMTLSRADDLKAQCPDDRCPGQLAAEGDRIDALAVVSTIGFIVGGTATAAGVVLVIVRPGGDDSSSASMNASVGPGRIDLQGRF